jgi:hypothetical protein
MSQTATTDLDELTSKVTAFNCWGEFVQAMINGYTPTLRPSKSRSKAEKAHNALIEELAQTCEAWGFKVWRGTNG